MRVHPFSKLLFIVALFSVLLMVASPARAKEAATAEAARMLPDRVAGFLARGAAYAPKTGSPGAVDSAAAEFGVLSAATRTYSSQKGETLTATLVQTKSDSAAYSLLTNLARWGAPEQAARVNDIGTAAFAWDGHLAFFKGPAFVYLRAGENSSDQAEVLAALARQLSASLDRGENDIPVLVKHLPEWETAHQHARYAISLQALQEAAGRRPVLDAVSFEGGMEAVTAAYGQSRLVLIENTTPQLATSNDARVNAKLNELRSSGGQSLPTAYRRVGNYSVFVFDAPDEATATKLIEGIKYEQVVQWLGQNPYAYQRAMRKYSETTAGVIVAVLKASGLSLLLCLGMGAVFGGIIFMRRRRRQATSAAFSDAGGMLRLNLDEITNRYDPARALGPGERR